MFMGVGLPYFRGNKWKDEDKTGKCPIYQGKGNFHYLSLNRKNTPYFTILTQNPLFDSQIEPENSKNYVFEQLFNISSILNLSLPLFLG